MNRKSAVILIEYQNDFTSKGGVFHDHVKSCMQQTDMMSNTRTVVEQARQRQVQIIHVPIAFSPDYHEIRHPTYSVLQNIIQNHAFLKNQWGSEITKEIPVHPQDIMIEGKRGLDGFYSTNLDFILRQLEIQSVVVSGFLTNCCVESTVRSAYEKGYEVTTLSDCCAAFGNEAHQNAITFDLPLFSHTLTHQEWIRKLQEQA